MRDTARGEFTRHTYSVVHTPYVAGAFAFALFAAVTAYAALDTSGSVPHSEREWKDDHGQVIKRVDAEGTMTLLTYDAQGLVIKIEGMAGRVDPEKTDGTPPGDVEWVHGFLYMDGKLASEVDCLGREHLLAEGCVPDVRRGTTLAGHKHVSNEPVAPPTQAGEGGTRFEYDENGTLTSQEEAK